jgi:hypothetical protein
MNRQLVIGNSRVCEDETAGKADFGDFAAIKAETYQYICTFKLFIATAKRMNSVHVSFAS